ncbi:ATP-binding cassette domain-containing protein [Bacillus gobiensis]|uniref:ABC transporter ATP-binding protein n=1 Tax=Bacillus gobiensis TaxID=1441095 RepID=UPI003D1F3A52
MVAYAEIIDLSFTYPDESEKALRSVSVRLEEGEFVVINGPSGCGKSTLLKHFKQEVLPVGDREGSIFYQGIAIHELDKVTSAREIGMVFQNPENQIVMETVIQEIAFSLENIGFPSEDIKKKIAELVRFLGIEHMLHQSVHTLSGGQKQLVNLASVLALQPKLLLLDEPTAQLDPVAAKEFLELLKRIHEELGVTIVVVEHRLDELLPLAERLIFMEKGTILYNDSPRSVIVDLWKDAAYRSYIPDIPRLFLESKSNTVPFSVKEGMKHINDRLPLHGSAEKKQHHEGKPLIKGTGLTFRYEMTSETVLSQLDIAVHSGDCMALVGANGSGKSTLLTILAGLHKPRKGKVVFQNQRIEKWTPQKRYMKIGYVSQQPAYHFTYDEVELELYERCRQFPELNPQPLADKLMDDFQLGHIKHRHPMDISEGEKQIFAIILALLSQPELLLLDEPTKGLDPEKKEQLGCLFQKLQHEGAAIMLATHDIEFAAKYANRCAMLFDGEIVSENDPAGFFSSNYFYTTGVNRLVRKKQPYALTWEDVNMLCQNDQTLRM